MIILQLQPVEDIVKATLHNCWQQYDTS